jgi:hypothetical protein
LTIRLSKRSLTQIIDALGKSTNSVEAKRVALYLHFLQVLSDVAEANRTIVSVIPTKFGVQLSDEEDFVFQVNSPEVSKIVAGTKLNALTKWSVERIQVVSIFAPSPGIPIQVAGPLQQDAKIFTASTVAFDNSTPVDNARPFDNVQQTGLLREELAMATEMQKQIGLNVVGF